MHMPRPWKSRMKSAFPSRTQSWRCGCSWPPKSCSSWDLSAGNVPGAVRQVFGHHGIPLTAAAVISSAGHDHWTIKDGFNQYSLEPDEKNTTLLMVHGPLPGGGLWPSLYFTLTGFHGLHV